MRSLQIGAKCVRYAENITMRVAYMVPRVNTICTVGCHEPSVGGISFDTGRAPGQQLTTQADLEKRDPEEAVK